MPGAGGNAPHGGASWPRTRWKSSRVEDGPTMAGLGVACRDITSRQLPADLVYLRGILIPLIAIAEGTRLTRGSMRP